MGEEGLLVEGVLLGSLTAPSHPYPRWLLPPPVAGRGTSWTGKGEMGRWGARQGVGRESQEARRTAEVRRGMRDGGWRLGHREHLWGGDVKEQEKSCWTPVNWCEHRPVLDEASWFVIFTHQSIYFG